MRLITPEISWHGKEPIFSVDFAFNSKSIRLATCGGDSNIRIWSVTSNDCSDSKVDFISNLSRHTKAVNVVRFAPNGNVLASGGDDCYVILWKLSGNEADCSDESMDCDDIENKESWQAMKMLRGHIEDVYDIAWSPDGTQLISGSVDNCAIVWDALKGEKVRMLTDHRQYVQGVCWDPCGLYVVSYSCDRTCRIYSTPNYRRCYNINKITVTSGTTTPNGRETSKQMKMFHDETMLSFFRRLTFSPEGSLLLVPGGKYEVNGKAVNTTYVFTKASLNKPVMYFPASNEPTIAVRCCPVLFHLRKSGDKGMENDTKSVFKLPYRIVIAVASLDCVVFYDTQQLLPFAFLTNIHYASLTDIAWSNDGRFLAISSSDGYCSIATFDEDELGIPYIQTPSEVMKNMKTLKGSSPVASSHPPLTPKAKKPESIKDDNNTSPNIEKLSIRNFVTVAPSRSNTRNNEDESCSVKEKGNKNVKQIRRVDFVTIKPAPNLEQQSNDNNQSATTAAASQTQVKTEIIRNSNGTVKQVRRVSFVTLKSEGKTDGQNYGGNNTTCFNPIENQSSIARPSTAETYGVDVVKIKPLKTLAERSQDPSPKENELSSAADEAKTNNTAVSPEQSSVGITSPQPVKNLCSTPIITSVNDINGTSSVVKTEFHTELRYAMTEMDNTPNTYSFKTSPLGNAATDLSSSTKDYDEASVKNSLTRNEKPPLPLEPQIVILND